jgi:cell pole-organizing protein PopZ
MTQPAKVQEPSMEEILASIRRIIADDEAKPPAAEKPPAPTPVHAKPEKPAPVAAAPAAKPAVMTDIPPSKIPAAVAAPPSAPPPPPAPAPAAAPNNQDDIDALLSGLDEATSLDEIRPSQADVQADVEVLELTDEMAVPSAPSPQPSFHKVEPHDDLEFTESVASRAINRAPAYDPPSFEPSPPPPPAQPILSQSTVSAVESAFNTLAHTVLSHNARTLEDLVREMLRPMLKSWLDDNLPGLVERIVKAEIERVSRGR